MLVQGFASSGGLTLKYHTCSNPSTVHRFSCSQPITQANKSLLDGAAALIPAALDEQSSGALARQVRVSCLCCVRLNAELWSPWGRGTDRWENCAAEPSIPHFKGIQILSLLPKTVIKVSSSSKYPLITFYAILHPFHKTSLASYFPQRFGIIIHSTGGTVIKQQNRCKSLLHLLIT